MLILSLVLIISGGVGNLIDRVTMGFVTDLFDFRIFPVFNVADIAICTGCFFLVLYVLFFDGKEGEKDERKQGAS
jgi:signal peptidase II